jgi:hypothetical protein
LRPARSAQSSKTCLTSLCSIVFQSDGQRKYVCRRTRRRVGCRGGKCQEEFVGEIGRTGRFVRFVSHRQTLGVLDCSAFTAAFGSSRSSNAKTQRRRGTGIFFAFYSSPRPKAALKSPQSKRCRAFPASSNHAKRLDCARVHRRFWFGKQ